MSGTALFPGIATGLCAAFFSALSYLATRYFTHSRTASATGKLLIISHIQMGVVSAMALPLMLWIGDLSLPPIGQWIGSLAAVVLLYLIGHTGLMFALRNSEPSRVSPMMALKLVVLAALAVALGPRPLSVLQWVAISLCAAAGLSLNYTGGRLHVRAIFGLAIAVIFYSVSDWNAPLLMNRLNLPPITAGFVAFFLTYILAGMLAIPLLFFASRERRDWVDVIPFSISWFISVAAPYACFAMAGAVFGNILQSTRGIMSIGLAAPIARLGHVHLESLTPRSVMVRRIVAAILMTVAIGLYSYERQRLDHPPIKAGVAANPAHQ